MPILFSFPEEKAFGSKIVEQTSFEHGEFSIHRFPDGDSLVTIHSDVHNKDVLIICRLHNADHKAMPLLFFARTARELGAKRIGLLAPYLGYMRQDKRFSPGEAITSNIFAAFVSSFVDWMITLDPHLHRYTSLDEIYTIPTTVLHATEAIGNWIKDYVTRPLLVGPDEESRQWVQQVAMQADAPSLILKKIRHGDRNVEVSGLDIEQYRTLTPVLVDDIISTGKTMLAAINLLQDAGLTSPICIGIHAIFAEGAYGGLKDAGVANIVTTNSLIHESNGIDVSSLFSGAIKHLIS